MKQKLLALLVTLLGMLPNELVANNMNLQLAEVKTLVSEDWDGTSAKEIWYDDLVVWEIDWVQTYSDGSTVRKTFQNSDERSLKVLSDWMIKDTLAFNMKFNTTAPTVSETVTSWLDQIRTVDGAKFEWKRDIREFSTEVTCITEDEHLTEIGETKKYNRYKAIDPSNCSVTYKGKVYSFVHHQSVSAVNTSTSSSYSSGSHKGTKYAIAPYTSKLSYTIGDNTKDVYAFGTGIKLVDPYFFPVDWGELKEIYQTQVLNESGLGHVYVWSLHFSRGYILPVVVRPGASNPEYHFEYVLKTDNNSYNSAVYNSKTNRWDNAIVGTGSFTDRYNLKIENGRFSAKDNNTGNQMGTWSSCPDDVFPGFDMTIYCGSGGSVEYNGNEVGYESGTWTQGKTFSVNSSQPVPVNIYIKPEAGYRLKGITRGENDLSYSSFTGSYYISGGVDARGYLDGNKLSFQNVCSNIRLYFQFEKIPTPSGTTFDYQYNNVCYRVNFTERTASVLTAVSNIITKASIQNLTLSGNTILESMELPKDQLVNVGNEILQPTATYNFTVNSISKHAFSNCTILASVSIPNTVTTIGESAFYNCKNLTSIDIPNSVTTIEEGAFSDCAKLASVSIPNSVTSIGSQSFYNCKSLTNVTIGNSVNAIGKWTFYNCERLSTLSLGESVETIDQEAFYNCKGLKTVTIPNKVRSIGDNAFYGCVGLSTLSLGEALETIGQGAFNNCKNITAVSIPNKVRVIGENAFGNCENIKNLTLGTSVETIGDGAFFNCMNLTAVSIPNKVRVIGENAFGNCESIKNLTLGTSVETIGEGAFNYCTSLQSVAIPNSVKTIDARAFDACYSLSSVLISKDSHLVTIGAAAFQECNYLKEVTLPATLETIGDEAFFLDSDMKVYSYIESPFAIDAFGYDEANILYVPAGTKSKYLSTQGWGDAFGTIIEEGATSDGITLTAKSYTRQYGEANPTFEYTVTGGSITSGKPTISCSATATSPVGTYDIVISKGTVSNNGTVNLVKGTLTITKAPLTISAGNYNKVEGEDNPVFTPTFSGFKNNETKAVLTKQPVITTTAMKASKAGSYPVTVSGAEAQNYSISYQSGTLTVTASGTPVTNPEPYAVLSDNNTVLTFYYDGNKASRSGMSVGPFNGSADRGWNGQCTSITTAVFDSSIANCTTLTSTSRWFEKCSNLTTISGIENLKTESVTDMSMMFWGCSKLSSLDASTFNTKKVTNMNSMFSGCSKLTFIDVSKFNTEMVTSMHRMFYDCQSLTYLNVSGFKTQNVTEMSGMFYQCYNLTNLDVSRFDTRNVKYIDSMFDFCSSLTSLDVSGFKTDKAWNMFAMFRGCKLLTNLDVSGFNTSNVQNMNSMFQYCENLSSLDVRGFNTSKVTDMHLMFESCKKLTDLDVSNFTNENVKDLRYMFQYCKELTSINLGRFTNNKVENMGSMFYGCSNLKTIYVGEGNWNMENVLYGDRMFDGCTNLRGGNGTTYSSSKIDFEYARIDKIGTPGYLTGIYVEKDDVTLTAMSYTREYGKPNPMFEYTVSDGTVTSGTPTITCSATATSPVGTYDIVISKGTVGNNGTVNLVKGILTITKAPLTISAGNYNKVEGEDIPVFTPVFSGFKNNETKAVLTKQPTVTTTATKTSKAGSYPVSVSGAEAQNYSITYENGTLIVTEKEAPKVDVTLAAMSYTREYGEANPMFEYTVSDGIITSGTPTITCSATATSPVGTYDIVISKGTVGNNGTVNLVKGTLTITKAPLTIAAGNYMKEEGEDNPEFTPVFNGFKNGETKDVLTKQPTITTTATKASKAGNYPVSISGAEAQNYEITYEPGTLTVTEPIVDVTLTAKSYTREYGEANPTFEYDVTDGTITSGTPEITCEATATSPVGTYDIVISKGTVSNNGTVNLVKGTLTITKAPLTISVGDYTKEEGEDNPEFIPVFTGFKNNETEDVLTKQPIVTSTATKDSPAGVYEIIVSGAEAHNYSISYQSGTLTVTEKPVELEAIEGESTMNTDALGGRDLSDNVIGNIYYVIGENGYDSTDKSIVISQPTNMGQIADKQPGSADVKENFNGMILKVAKGKGFITVNVKTSGNAQLVVQVGNGTPMLASKTEKGDVVFSYDVEEDTYVYIYAIIGSSAAKGFGINATDTDSSVRIYGITVSPGATGIRSIGSSEKNDNIIYDLQGRRVKNTAKGVYIVGGRKYSVK